MTTDWTREEVETTVSSYLHMWLLEQAGQSYSKAEHSRALMQTLNGRTKAAIEYKHQNISAILMEHGWQNIPGYKPAGNYQRLLADIVAARIMQNRQFDRAAEMAADQSAVVPVLTSLEGVLVDCPVVAPSAHEERAPYFVAQKPMLKRDYLDREARNTSLGKAGEEFVVDFEQRRLHALGKKKLAEHVVHASATEGDGLGYDVRSFDESGRDRFIEVKTTAWGKETPFFISRNELDFSKAFADQFHLYRVFEFR